MPRSRSATWVSGPGSCAAAYAQLPRYFADSGKVEDLESRLVTCRSTLQGIAPEEAKKNPFGDPGRKTVNDALVAYVTSESRGVKMNVRTSHPKEAQAYEIGRKIFFHRGGPYDFACATCHGVDNIRIRLQDLPTSPSRWYWRRAPYTRGRPPRLPGRGGDVPVALEDASPAALSRTWSSLPRPPSP